MQKECEAEKKNVRNAIAKNASVRAAIVQARDRAKALLAGRIPYLQAHLRVCVTVDDALGHEGSADGTRDLRRVEGALAVAHDQARLADALRAEHNDLGLKRRGHCGWLRRGGARPGVARLGRTLGWVHGEGLADSCWVSLLLVSGRAALVPVRPVCDCGCMYVCMGVGRSTDSVWGLCAPSNSERPSFTSARGIYCGLIGVGVVDERNEKIGMGEGELIQGQYIADS